MEDFIESDGGPDDGRLFVRLTLVTQPNIAFNDRLHMTFFDGGMNEPYIRLDDALKWLAEQVYELRRRRQDCQRYADLLEALRDYKKRWDD